MPIKKLTIAYHIPSLDTIYAGRTIFNGYKNAFTDLGHHFYTFTANENLEEFLDKISPNIFITSSHFYYRKFLDYKLMRKYRDRGMFLLTMIDFWNSPVSIDRVNEARSMKNDKELINLIKEGLLGDAFYHVVEHGDKRMEGFEKGTGYEWYTIPLAADALTMKNAEFEERFVADISFIGTYLSDKKQFFDTHVFPLKKRHNMKLYGQDWTQKDRMLGWIQRGGQYFNIPYLRSIQKPKLRLEDEGSIYKSSIVSINVHEMYQKKFGGDCNERTFKVPLAGGFEITDDVACIRKYFVPGKEIIIAESTQDWFDKIDYYIKNPEKRLKIMKAGKERVLEDHTYHNRVENIISLYNKH